MMYNAKKTSLIYNPVIARFADRLVRSHSYNKRVPKYRLNDLLVLLLANREIDKGTSRILNKSTISSIIVSFMIKVHSL